MEAGGMAPSLGNVSLTPGSVSTAAPQNAAHQQAGGTHFFASSSGAQESSSFFQQSAAQDMSQQMAGQLARSAAAQAAGLFRRGAGEIQVYVEKNHYSVHALSLCGGVFLCCVSLVGLLNIFAPLTGPLSYLLHFYQLCFGLLICVVDGPSDNVPRAKDFVVQYAPQLHNNTGRALFYLFIACLEGSQDNLVHMLCGWYFFGIAVMHTALKVRSSASNGEANEREEVLLS
eukprot:TRINITY_DN23996_c0_g1_i1.p1 TRINITY_DN23996_c0_g1~~TRINITY_DN23996_c0_g1_i1.p1  ORF type:complete len:255 (+),score=49.37 TRINITY_DN23996_c0_g1_i1:77-766(+)